MKCPKCNMNLDDDARFCMHCGEMFIKKTNKVYCNKCGAKLIEGDKYCTSCGQSVNGPIIKTYNYNNNSNREKYVPVVKEKVIKVDKSDDKPLAKEGLIVGLVLCVLLVSISSIFIISYCARDYEPRYYIK